MFFIICKNEHLYRKAADDSQLAFLKFCCFGFEGQKLMPTAKLEMYSVITHLQSTLKPIHSVCELMISQ